MGPKVKTKQIKTPNACLRYTQTYKGPLHPSWSLLMMWQWWTLDKELS